MSQLFELVIFTAGMAEYTDLVLKNIDMQKRISHVLYREHCTVLNGSYFLKNLTHLGRNLKQTLLIDVTYTILRTTQWLAFCTQKYSTRLNPSTEMSTIESCYDL
jgi:hypothetical protein